MRDTRRTARVQAPPGLAWAAAALAALALAVPPPASPALPGRVAAFYYPWYGTPERDGGWLHWAQRDAAPPLAIASGFWPARGLYSSADRVVVGAQMRDLARAGVDEAVVSWWGRGSPEDARLALVLGEARAAGLAAAAHVEPYGGRTPATVAEDAAYLRGLGIGTIYVFAAELSPAAEWAAARAALGPTRVFGQTALAGFAAAAGFDGLYTYDVLVYGPARFARLCGQARRVGLLCAPSVGPGFDARRATGEPRVKPRRDGRTYDGMWRSAIAARPPVVTVTSYNEWLEGTQIEPARSQPGFRGYDGAWGRRGRRAERAYLDRTAYWAARYRRALGRSAAR